MTVLRLIITSVLLVSMDLYSYEPSEINEIIGKKRSIYRDAGIFHNGIKESGNVLKGLRHSGKKINSYERIVFDFESIGAPQIYAHIDKSINKLQVDFLRTKLNKKIKPAFSSHRVKEINFFPLAGNVLSTEIVLKENTYVEMFILEKPTRLVIDFKN